MKLVNQIAIMPLIWAVVVPGYISAQVPSGKKPVTAAAAATSPADRELAAIRAKSQAFVEAFNKNDANAVAAHWTVDGEFIDDAGRRYSGREEIAQGYAGLFASIPNAQLRMAIDSLRLLSPSAALEEGTAVVEPSPAGASGVSRYTVVHVKVDGDWQMASVRDTWVETPPAEQSAADLEWLVGTWVAEEHGNRTESHCRWMDNNRFLERKYTTTRFDGSQSTGIQLIGWNPLEGHVQSWDFSPDGGHAVGIWTPTEGGWQAEVTGFTGAGIPTAAVNILKRLDDNAYVWQSVRRRLGEISVPDTDEVILKRSPTP